MEFPVLRRKLRALQTPQTRVLESLEENDNSVTINLLPFLYATVDESVAISSKDVRNTIRVECNVKGFPANKDFNAFIVGFKWYF